MLPLPRASPADIIRANTKDEEYISTLETNLDEILQSSLPNRTSSTIQTASRTAARLCYYLLTPSGLLHRTPGEEYASVLGVHVTDRLSLPNRATRVLLGVLRSVTSDDAVWVLAKLWRRFCDIPWPEGFANTVVEGFQRGHLAIFYGRGKYYGLAERLARIRYAATAGWGSGTRLNLLGWFVGLQLLCDIIRALVRGVRRAIREGGCGSVWEILGRTAQVMVFPSEGSSGEEGVGRCMMCLGGLRRPTLTGCGHVFCWECICGWCTANEDCPLCRQGVMMRKLLFTTVYINNNKMIGFVGALRLGSCGRLIQIESTTFGRSPRRWTTIRACSSNSSGNARTSERPHFEIIQEKQLFKRYQTVYQRDVRYPSGEVVSFDITANAASEHKSVFVFPFCTKSQTVTLLREYSPGQNRQTLSFVAGMYESQKHKDLVTAARAELHEEAGLRGGELVALAGGVAADKYSVNKFYYYLALDCVKEDIGERDAEEWIEVVDGIGLVEVRNIVEGGQMNAPNSLTALLALEKLRTMGFEK